MTKQEKQREFGLEDLPGEEWKAINDDYQISNFGRVKSFKYKTPRILKPSLPRDYLSENVQHAFDSASHRRQSA